MKTLFTVLILSALGSTAALAGEWTGYVSDTKCAASKPAAFEECAKKCVQEGSAPVFVTADNKIVKIGAGAKDKIMPLLGHKVTLTGKIDGDTLVQIDTISSVKM